MFVITADQKASRTGSDLVPSTIRSISRIAGRRLALPAERSAGDELQTATADAATALEIVLALTRDRRWSVGLAAGDVELPLPQETRAARGTAFIFAREAVERAKSAPGRVAVGAERTVDASDAEALLRLLVTVRDRRTAQGWETADLLATGMTQKQAAAQLGISPAAVSLRASTAGLRVEEGAVPALARILTRLDG
jgi:hypothetical protein